MKNSARLVQPVVPADTCGSKGSERSCEPAVPAEVDSGAGGVIAWLREKLDEAEKSLRVREQMAQSWRMGTDAEWEAAAKLHPDTANEPPMKKSDRLKASAAQGRIAMKCRRDVEMFKAVLAALGGGGGFETVAANEVIPYERAKGLAVACWQVRDKWCQQAYDFWLGQYASTGEPEVHEIVNLIHDLWMTTRAKVRELEGAGAVGGSWLVEATFEQQKAKSPHSPATAGRRGAGGDFQTTNAERPK